MGVCIRRIFMLWLIMVMLQCLGKAIICSEKRYINIQNVLEDNEDLTLHCKSKDDDLGVQHLKPLEHWEFQFYPNFLGRTLSFCSFGWKGCLPLQRWQLNSPLPLDTSLTRLLSLFSRPLSPFAHATDDGGYSSSGSARAFGGGDGVTAWQW
ncbi:hypothetical protein HN873_013598 [Arachis hypogaea]